MAVTTREWWQDEHDQPCVPGIPLVPGFDEISEVPPDLYDKLLGWHHQHPKLSVIMTNPTKDSWVKKWFLG